ncbi:hypothetical protein AMJ86_07420 [bacterium SM23_57]|nr:MAG: hypothetical protein AMJ86_07420 [bacterium SM23_57]
MNIRIKSDNIPGTISSIESSIKKFVPTDTFDYRFLDENINNLYWTERLTSNLIGYFTILAIFISCIGLFGLVSFAAEQRTKEIGIRKTLGATVTNIITLLSKEFLILVTIANIIAWPIAFIAMNQWLNSFAYHINITWTTFVVAAILAMFIGIATVSIQAMKAALANPIKSLRYE